MIYVAGNAVQPDSLGFSADSTERQVAGIMAASSAAYRYDSLDELKFDLRLRRETVNAARALDRSGMDFEIFRRSRCNPAYWERDMDGGFTLRSGADPAAAIQDIFQNGRKYGTECATAMVIVYYGALLAVFGADRFNRLFPRIELMNWHHIDRLLAGIAMMRKRDDYLPGDRRYFANPDVDPMTPEWQGENVIDLNGKLYYGHGIGISSAADIIHSLNQNRAEHADDSAYLVDASGRLDAQQLFALYNQS